MTDLSGGSLPLVAPSAGGNAGALLPAVTPSPVNQQPAPGDGTAAVANTSPLNRRLMGTQLLALAALCAAIGLVIARFTLRSPRPLPSGAGTAATGTGAAAEGGNTSGGRTIDGNGSARDNKAAGEQGGNGADTSADS
jgi:hypothetical protein